MVTEWGAKGLAWAKITENGWQSSLDKFFDSEQKERINRELGACAGDLILIVGDKKESVNRCLGMLRLELAKRLNLIEKGDFSFVWITEFPLVEYNETENRLAAVHHPFATSRSCYHGTPPAWPLPWRPC